MTTDTLRLPAPAPVPPTLSRARAITALFAMSATSFVLVGAEFLPGGLLTAIAPELGVSPGAAGQSVTVTAIAGLIAALAISSVFPKLDRRLLMAGLAVAAAVSDIAVALSPNLTLLLVSRVLIGFAIGGFWSLSLAVVSTMISDVARGMMIVNLGNTLATVVGVPLGIWASSYLDWRMVFVAAGVLTAGVAVLLFITLPSIRPQRGVGFRSLVSAVGRSGVAIALIGHSLVVFGHMGAYAFIRVRLEEVPGFAGGGAAIALTVFGIGGLTGNLVVGWFASRAFAVIRVAVPITLGAAIIAIAIWPNPVLLLVAAGVWGASFGAWLVVINTWSSNRLPDQLEAGGALIVVGFHVGIAGGAALGGWVVDVVGTQWLFLGAGIVAVVGAVLFAMSRLRPAPADEVSG